MVNSVDPDQTLHFAASDLGLHCLLMPVCLNPYCENTVFSGMVLFISD